MTALLSAFLLNLAWEYLHRPLYLNYQGGAITDFILIRAAAWDALIILALIWLFRKLPKKRQQWWVFMLAGLVVAFTMERWALATDRWVYAPAMPIIPWLAVGLSPMLQLAFTGWLAYRTTFRQPPTKKHEEIS